MPLQDANPTPSFGGFGLNLLRENQNVLLLEEPGTHLHPRAQEKLKRLISDEVSKHRQVIYTTHLPGMVTSRQVV